MTRSDGHIPHKVNRAPFEISKYKSGAGLTVFFSHFNRVKMSEATPSDLYFEISNGACEYYFNKDQ